MVSSLGTTTPIHINREIILNRRLVFGLTLISLTTTSALARSPSNEYKFMVATVNLMAFQHGEEYP